LHVKHVEKALTRVACSLMAMKQRCDKLLAGGGSHQRVCCLLKLDN
jgi:hypothetical protein